MATQSYTADVTECHPGTPKMSERGDFDLYELPTKEMELEVGDDHHHQQQHQQQQEHESDDDEQDEKGGGGGGASQSDPTMSNTSSKVKTGFMCDLCNERILNDREVHLRVHHATLRGWCNSVLLEERNEVMNMTVELKHTKALGDFVVESVAHLDKGRKAFEVVQRASRQLNEIFNLSSKELMVFLFGSCVSSGSWDGVGDADFTVLNLKSLDKLDWPPPNEAAFILKFARLLRRAGFQFDELTPVIRARVPVVKRVQKVRMPLRLSDPLDSFKIVYHYDEGSSKWRLDALMEELRKKGAEIEDVTPTYLTASLKQDEAAMRLFYRRERCDLRGLCKFWKVDHPLPDIFSLDFDISCRPMGVRNSWLMRSYLLQGPEVRAGSAFLKRWSKQWGINNPVKGFLTSYAVTILWVHFLLRSGFVQYVVPDSVPYAPIPLQQEVPYVPLLRNTGDGGDSPGDVLRCTSLEETRCTLGDLVTRFFLFYVNFPWEEEVVTLRMRNYEPVMERRSIGWVEANEVHASTLRDCVWYRVCIEDPYEENLNLGRHLSPDKSAFVKAQFVRAFAAVMHGRLQQLLVDEQQMANATVQAQLRRAEKEGSLDENEFSSWSLSDVRELLIARLGERALAQYELQHRIETLCKKRSEKFAGSKEGNEFLLSPRSCLRETDERLQKAGRLGLPVSDIHKEVLDAYFIWGGRIFATAEERDIVARHVNAVSRILSRGGSMQREEVHAMMQGEIPTAMREDALVDKLLVDDGDKILHLAISVDGAPVESVLRMKSHPKPKIPSKPNQKHEILHPAGGAFSGTCDQCGRSRGDLRATSNREKDSGRYCQICWRAYEQAQKGN